MHHIRPPAISTVHAVLDRNDLVKRRKRKRHKAQGTQLIGANQPNGLWCADYKGEFMLGNRQCCYLVGSRAGARFGSIRRARRECGSSDSALS